MQKPVVGVSTPKEGWLKVSDLNMHYLDWGGAGPTVVALHGMSSGSHWYDLVIPYLTDTFHFIAPDQRAHGKTDQASTGYDWKTLAGDIVGALDHLDIQHAAVIGHSWGASVALSVAALHPDRVTKLAMIEGGFAVGPRGPDMTWEEFKTRRAPRDIYGPRERYLDALRQQFADVWSDQMESMVLSMARIDPDGSVHECLEPETHEQILWATWSEPTHQMFPKLRCPTLLVAAIRSGADINTEFIQRRRQAVEAARAAIPQSQVVWISGSSHDIGYQKPQELADTLRDFLSAA